MKRSKMLLVDDSTVIQTLSSKIFYGMGIDVISEKRGTDVIDRVMNNDIDVIVLDIILPDSNGLKIAEQIRSLNDPSKSNLPIIVISGNYDNYTSDDFKKLDIPDYLIKPLDYDNLVKKVKKYL